MSENDDIRRESDTCLPRYEKSTNVSSMFKHALLGLLIFQTILYLRRIPLH